MDIKLEIRNLLESEFNTHHLDINDDSDLFLNEVLDSIGTIRLFLRLEDKFDITIDQAELDIQDFVTINAIYQYVIIRLKGEIK